MKEPISRREIHADKSQWWRVDGTLHRLDGPAVIYTDGTQCWCQDGLLHRLDGPAVIYADGTPHEWWANGKLCTTNESYRKEASLTDEDMLIIILKYSNIGCSPFTWPL